MQFLILFYFCWGWKKNVYIRGEFFCTKRTLWDKALRMISIYLFDYIDMSCSGFDSLCYRALEEVIRWAVIMKHTLYSSIWGYLKRTHDGMEAAKVFWVDWFSYKLFTVGCKIIRSETGLFGLWLHLITILRYRLTLHIKLTMYVHDLIISYCVYIQYVFVYIGMSLKL